MAMPVREAPDPDAPFVGALRGAAAILVPSDAGTVDLDRAVTIDELGQRIWNELCRGATPDTLASDIAKTHTISVARARADIDRFLDQLDAAGLPLSALHLIPDTGEETAPGIPVEPVTSAEFTDLVRAALDDGRRIRFTARGFSMRPQIPHGTRIEVVNRTFASVRPGAIALYSTPTHRLVAHRIVGRRGEHLLARGDSAARLDLVSIQHYLGVVTARIADGGQRRIPLDGPGKQLAGRFAGLWHRGLAITTRVLIVTPLTRSPWLRRAARWLFKLISRCLLAVERRSHRLRHRIDIGRSALLLPDEKDAERHRLYETTAVQEFTALDENVTAGLTLIEEVLILRHPSPPGTSALVVGCGPGRECVALDRLGMRVTGLDRAAGMLARGEALVKEEGADVRFVLGEADGFGLPGERFDRVIVFSGLYNMMLPRSRRIGLLRESREHLAPGGRIFVTYLSDYVKPDAPATPERRTLWHAINPSHVEGDRYLLNETVHIFPHSDDFLAEVADAGLTVEELSRDQRAYDRQTRQVRGYAILMVPS